ncbi:MAG: hypothetical protein WC736_15730 [Gallionella sp.]|jgi:predicted HAD superfamily Cof-like phosphohydrolase
MEKVILIALDTDLSDVELGDAVAAALGNMQDQTSDGNGSPPAVICAGTPKHRFSDRVDVLAFQQKFRIPMAKEPSWLPEELFQFRYMFLQEELHEFYVAQLERDMEGAADALVDLCYMLHGTALMMGLPWPVLWEEVHRKNLLKVRATSSKESKRHSSFDIIKPAGWVGPDHSKALGKGPWPTLKGDES